jgi:hypothetical protein
MLWPFGRAPTAAVLISRADFPPLATVPHDRKNLCCSLSAAGSVETEQAMELLETCGLSGSFVPVATALKPETQKPKRKKIMAMGIARRGMSGPLFY